MNVIISVICIVGLFSLPNHIECLNYSKYYLLVLPTIDISLFFLLKKILKEKTYINNEENEIVKIKEGINKAFWLISMILTISLCIIILCGLNYFNIDYFSSTMTFMLSVMCMLLAPNMMEVKPNKIFGFRTSKTLSNEIVWKKSNVIAGKIFFIIGLVGIIDAIVVGGVISEVILAIITLIGTALMYILSNKIYNNEIKKK